ncbi:hypothetical protein [Phycobacter azelaicus]|uniref:hypothetical protein n=1 Tax=Phycobacter azelaicus TaxID=2668075 RepID=UPI001865F8C5|nr:hypothetical protein [Phycobacter azelaicus]MBE1295283.1 hypothetical protein [Paracoccaceae bacterium]
MKFTVELEDESITDGSTAAVHLLLDGEAIDQLIADLKQLREAERMKSVRLFTEALGPGELSSEQQLPTSSMINHLRIWKI